MHPSTSLLLFSLGALAVSSSALVPLEAGWAAYRSLLVQQPVMTKALTSGAIMGLSDGITQGLERQMGFDNLNKKHNWLRTWHTVVTGICWSGPSAHYWYASLEEICKVFPVYTPIAGLFQRIILDALIFSPITIAGFFVCNTFIQRGPRNARATIEEIRQKMSTKWAKAVVGAWMFWPTVNLFNFSLVPLSYRVLYANVMSLFWSGYLSFVNYQKKKTTSKHGLAPSQ